MQISYIFSDNVFILTCEETELFERKQEMNSKCEMCPSVVQAMKESISFNTLKHSRIQNNEPSSNCLSFNV